MVKSNVNVNHEVAPSLSLSYHFNETRDDGAAVASAGPYTHHLHLAPDR